MRLPPLYCYLASAAALIGSIIPISMGIEQRQGEAILRERGIKANAEVVHAWIEIPRRSRMDDRDDGYRQPEYHLRVRYGQPPRAVEKEFLVSPSTYYPAEAERQLKIVYDPNNPSLSILDGGRNPTSSNRSFLYAGLLVLVGIGLFFLGRVNGNEQGMTAYTET